MSQPAASSTSLPVIPTTAQLVYALTNPYPLFSFKLTAEGSKYKLWCRIFRDICHRAKCFGYLTGDNLPKDDTDEEWFSIDSCIKSWFYATVDANLLQIITKDTCTSKHLWDELNRFFLNNKMSRSLQLKETFCNTKKGSLSITDYCHHLKHLADALNDVDSKVDEVELVMQILRNLPPSYQSMVDVITNKVPFPSFLEAKDMLILHESRVELHDPPLDNLANSSSALYSSQNFNNNGKGKNKNKNNKNIRGANKVGGILIVLMLF